MDSSQLSFFRSADILVKPPSWPVDDFCTLTLSELKGIQDDNIQVDEIRHYKEIDGLEHEFMLASVKDGGNRYLLRIERSTPARIRRTFWQKLKQNSASILPAFDSVSVSSSFKKLTTDMDRGPIIHVATLPISSAPVALRDFCLLLSLFPSFSPTYKLKEEQCYWFCNVVVATISSVRGVEPDPGIGFQKAGKYGQFSIHMSPQARQLFIEGYKLAQRVQSQSDEELKDVELTAGTAQALVAMLSVHSEGARTRALLCVTSLSSNSLTNRQQLLDAGVVNHLGLIFVSSSTKIKALIFQALDIFGASDFKPFPDPKLVEEVGIPAIEDTFTEGDQKAMDAQYTKAIEDMIVLCGDDRPNVHSWSARVISEFSWDEKCFPLILRSILHMATSDVLDVQLTSIRVITEISQYLYLQDVMTQVFPVLLNGPHRDVRVACIVSLRKLADQDQLRRQCITIFPPVALLFVDNSDRMASKIEELYFDIDDSMKRVEKAIAYKIADLKLDDLDLMGLQAISVATKHPILYPIITDNLPRILGFLTVTDKLWRVRSAAVDVLSELITISEFQPYVEEAIPKVLDVPRDCNSDVQRSTVQFITKAASTDFYPIILSLFSKIVDLLADQSFTRRETAINLLSRLTRIAEFRPRVEEVIPQVLCLLDDRIWFVQIAAFDFIEKISPYFHNHPAVIGTIFQLPHFLCRPDMDYLIATLLCNLMEYADLRHHIQNIIPEVKQLQRHKDLLIIKSANMVIAKASEYGMDVSLDI